MNFLSYKEIGKFNGPRHKKMSDTRLPCSYSQIWPCEHPAKTVTERKRTATNSPAKTNYRHLAEINSRYYGLSLMRTLTQGPYSVRYKGVDCIMLISYLLPKFYIRFYRGTQRWFPVKYLFGSERQIFSLEFSILEEG